MLRPALEVEKGKMWIKILAELKDALTKGRKLQTKYFVLLSEQKTHENFHPMGDATLFILREFILRSYRKYMILLLMLFRK